MSTTGNEYNKMAKEASPNSPVFVDCLKAFLIGGTVCLLGQVFNFLFQKAGFNEEYVKALTPSVLIIITAILTGIGVFDKIAKHAGAGTIVPITGFANSVVSPALEFKAEGFILGVGANMFKIAGPVIVYGTVASLVYGIIYWVTTLF